MKRTEALAKVAASRSEWEALIASIPRERMDEPLWEDGWTAKSVIAHVDFYEWWTGEFFLQRDWPVVDDRLNTWDVDVRNAVLNEINQPRKLDEILGESGERHAHLVNALATMTDEQFADPEFLKLNLGPDWSPENLLAGATWGHYPQHTPDLVGLINPTV